MKWALLGRLFRTEITTDMIGENVFKIIERINHPQYKVGGSTSENNDIALYKLENPVELKPSIRPVCLFQKAKIPTRIGTKVTVTGWGKTAASKERSLLIFL